MVLPQVDVSGEAARAGTWRHDFWRHLAREGVERALAEMAPENRAEAETLDIWLPPGGADFEVALAYDFEEIGRAHV